ncbi:MAG: ABC transporter substrate-binding protein [Lachnospiraceae bacterium]|nr:ABC transporter substrate-binding protein [Lachnospiraceae bacterium]
MKKILPLLLVPALLLSGCGSVSEVILGAPIETVETQEDRTQIRMSWWGNDNRHEYTMNGIGIFEKENPDIKVKNTYGVWQGFERRMRVAMESHTEADVMQINYAWIDQYSPDGSGFYDLSELSDYIDLSNFEESDLQYGIKNGKLNALPIAFNSYEFYYNQVIWDKYGLEFPKTWDEVFAAAEVMREDGIYPFGFVKKQAFMLSLSWFEQTHGKRVFSEDGMLNVDEKELGEMLDFYRKMVDEKVMIPVEDFEKSKFADGTVAATMCWVSDAGNYCNALESKGGIPKIAGYLIPDDSKLSGWYIKPATMYAISAYTDHPQEAAKLLNFLINSPEMASLQMSEKGVPVSKTARQTLHDMPDSDISYEFMASEYMNENIDRLSIIQPVMENDEIISAFKECGDDYIYNKKTLAECSQSLYKTIAEKCNE